MGKAVRESWIAEVSGQKGTRGKYFVGGERKKVVVIELFGNVFRYTVWKVVCESIINVYICCRKL